MTPETYLGFDRLDRTLRRLGARAEHGRRPTPTRRRRSPRTLLAYGGRWGVGAQRIVAGPGAALGCTSTRRTCTSSSAARARCGSRRRQADRDAGRRTRTGSTPSRSVEHDRRRACCELSFTPGRAGVRVHLRLTACYDSDGPGRRAVVVLSRSSRKRRELRGERLARGQVAPRRPSRPTRLSSSST